MGGMIDIEQKGWESVIYGHDHDLLVTKVRCKLGSTGYSDRGDDFRYRQAIDPSRSSCDPSIPYHK